MAKVSKGAHLRLTLLWGKNCLDNEFFSVLCLNIARDLHIKVKKLDGHICFSTKKHKIVVFVQLRAIISQKGNNAISPQRDYPDAHLNKNDHHTSACALYAVYRVTRYALLKTWEADSDDQTNLT